MILLIITLLSLFILFYFHTFSPPPFLLLSFFPFLSFFFLSLCIPAMISSLILLFVSCTLLKEDTVISTKEEDLALGQEEPLEQEIAKQSSILAWKIPWAEDSGGLQSMGLAKNQAQLSTQEHTHKNLHTLKTFDNGYSSHSEHDCLLLRILWLLNKLGCQLILNLIYRTNTYIFILFIYFLATLHCWWDLSSLTRDQTEIQTEAVKIPSPNHWTTMEFPKQINFSTNIFHVI